MLYLGNGVRSVSQLVWTFVDGAEIAKKSQRRRTVAYDTAAASTGLVLEQMSRQLMLECVKAESW